MKKRRNFGEKYLLEILAVVLVCGLAFGLNGQLTGEGLKAQTDTSEGIVTAELTDDQPLQIGQLPNQWMARFKLSTTSQTEITINAITFYAEGNLRHQFSKRPTIVPLSVVVNSEVLGEGGEWTVPYGLMQQQVVLSSRSLVLSQTAPVTFDVYTDLTRLRDYTFGVELAKLDGPTGSWELSVSGLIHKIKAFL